MSDFTRRQEPGYLAPVEPLAAKSADGKSYERSAAVEAEIGRMLACNPSEWLREAPDLPNEVLVHLIGQIRDGDEDLYGGLMQVLSTRIHRLVRGRHRGRNKWMAEEIALTVEDEIFGLVLTRLPSIQRDFLEVAFADAVIKRTFNAIRNHNRTPFGRRGEILPGATGEDGDEIERPMELVADGGPSPQDEARTKEWFDRACAAVKNKRNLEALKLHFMEGMPIQSKDPNVMDLVRYFGVTEGQAKWMLASARNAIRKELSKEWSHEQK